MGCCGFYLSDSGIFHYSFLTLTVGLFYYCGIFMGGNEWLCVVVGHCRLFCQFSGLQCVVVENILILLDRCESLPFFVWIAVGPRG